MKFSKDDLDMLWIGSFRYYLGRMTIATHSFAESLVQHWGDIPERAQVVIKRDLQDAITRDDDCRANGDNYKPLGHDCDSKMWRAAFGAINR